MVFNRAKKPYHLLSLGELDEFGCHMPFVDTGKTVEGVLGLYSHSPVEDIRFNNVEYTFITDDEITINNAISNEDDVYKVIFVNNYGRHNQAFLKNGK